MEEIKPKKERKFLKAMGNIALTLLRELVLGIGKKVINKVGNKRQALAIAFVMVSGISYAAIDSIPYPITGNKQRLGWQTTGNGLVWRGVAADTVTKPTSYADKNVKAYLILDSVSGSLYVFKQGVWAAISGAGGGLTMPFDSITFNTAKDGIVGVGEVEYNDTQGSLVQGLKGGNVTNVIGQQLHQRVNNRTGATLNKGDVVYLSGSQGNRITVAKALATSDPTSANTFGIVAESIADNASGYVITEGLITGLNTLALTQDSAVYLSGTTPGALTSTKPQAPIHGVYIGVCVKSNAGSGEIFVKIRNGQELDELHDVQITSPVNNASFYYKSSEGLWRDTTAALLVSDTAAMLTPYFRDADTTSLNLTSRFAAKLNLSDTVSMLTNYLRTGVAASTYISGSGTANYIPKFTGTRILANSLIYDSGSMVGIGNNNPNYLLDLKTIDNAKIFLRGGISQNGILFDSISSINSFYLFNGTLTTSGFGIYDVTNNINRLWVKNDGNIGIGTTSPNAKLDVNGTILSSRLNVAGGNQNSILLNNASNGTTTGFLIGRSFASNNLQDLFIYDIENAAFRLNINSSGNIGIGTTNPLSKLEVHGSAVFNEGSTDSDFRVESDGNANMVFVDASTDRVGIGTNAPTKTLDVNGEVKIATTTATPTVLLGKDGSNVVGQLYIDGGLSIIGSNLYGIKPSYSSITGTSATYSSDYMNTVNALYIKVNNNSTVTITLPSATSQNGKSITVKNLGTGAVNSNSNNVEPFNSTSLGTSILSSGGGKWATLVSDGTNWVIMQAN